LSRRRPSPDKRARQGRPPRRDRPSHPAEDLLRIGGLPAVQAVFQRQPERVERLFFTPERRREAAPFCAVLGQARKPFREVGADELAKVAGTVLHGGIVALARPKPLLDFDPGAATAPLLLVLDGVSNPHNFGAIVRTAAFFGLDRLVISSHPAQAGPSAAAHRVAEGGFEFVDLHRATNLPAALKRLRPRYRVVGTALGKGGGLASLPRDKPLALVLGNEERGLDGATLAACDQVVTLAGSGAVQSLNVAATAAILIHALRPLPAAGPSH
jgi:RNA methyltransferase, TrmH family